MMTRRKERKAAYLNPQAGFMPLSFDLLLSAKQALKRALRDRKFEVVRLATNHYTPNAAATIILVTTALEVSMNEAIAKGSSVLGSSVERSLALLPTCDKFAKVCSGSDRFQPTATELRLLVDLRDEIVHYLPRAERSAAGNFPHWCQTLQKRGLFIEAPGSDYQFSQKIPSYALAYWSYEAAHEAIELFVRSLPDTTQRICGNLLHNFSCYQDVCPPAKLRKYDGENFLELTEWPGSDAT
jgi:hypothetical protein